MTWTTRWMLILCFIVASIAVAWDLTPLTAGRDKEKAKAVRLMQKQAGKRQDAAKTPTAKTVKPALPAGVRYLYVIMGWFHSRGRLPLEVSIIDGIQTRIRDGHW